MDNATATAVEIVDGCDYAGISLILKGRRVKSVAPTDEIVVRADQLQHETGEGPCLQSVSEHETVYAPDLRDDPRWPEWAPRAVAELGIRSALVMRLFVGPDSFGALNLFSTTPNAFKSVDRVSAHALAAHVAVAMTAAQDHQDMDSALISRTTIGQAEGMLMQALSISGDQAFAALVRVSQARNIKLHEIAADIVRNGIRPELFE